MYRVASRVAFRYLKKERRWPDHRRDDDALAEIPAPQIGEVAADVVNEIDGYRYRWQWSFGIMAALSQAVWIGLVFGSRHASEKQTILLATLALACTVFGGVFLLVLLIFRMTHKLLTAIEIAARRE